MKYEIFLSRVKKAPCNGFLIFFFLLSIIFVLMVLYHKILYGLGVGIQFVHLTFGSTNINIILNYPRNNNNHKIV